ncbi:hypothetical protein [Paludisphaera mucosa]|uniref:Uncharacterized protein n=1 Tax=Paludisphaera mucosa TaxID=3030827 RepID=A0ABT6FHX6_9BACT|nr:hypothetical protein [Paludisphaera mucosa]MDG3007142.1 hypothetical protein [Paludisphaera mucosa]
MKLKFACPNCGKAHAVDAAMAGKKGRCPQCGIVIRLPEAARPVAMKVGASRPEPPVHDPFGLDEALSASAGPLPPRRAPADEEASAPRRIRPTGGKAGGKRRGEPWNLPLRDLAIKAPVATLVVSALAVGLMSQPATRAAGVLVFMAAGLCSLASMLLAAVSMLGAAVSLVRGNGRAFSGESGGGQVAWALAVAFNVLCMVVTLAALPSGVASYHAALARQGGGSPTTPTFVYEGLIRSIIDINDQLAQSLETMPEPGTMAFSGHFNGVRTSTTFLRMNLDQSETTPLPTGGQVRELRRNLQGPLLQSLRRMAAAARAATARLQEVADPAARAAMDQVSTSAAKNEELIRAIESVGEGDPAWYRLATTTKAGTRVGGPPSSLVPNLPGHVPTPGG